MSAPCARLRRGVSLVEVLVATAVFVALMLMLFQVLDATLRGWGRAGRNAAAAARERDVGALIARDLAAACRSSLATNLVIETPGPDSGPGYRVFVLTVQPGGEGRVCAVGYFCAWNPRRGANGLVRALLPPAQVLHCLDRGGDPMALTQQPGALREEILAGVADFGVTAFDDAGRAVEESRAFTSNLPRRIEITLRTLSEGTAREESATKTIASVVLPR